MAVKSKQVEVQVVVGTFAYYRPDEERMSADLGAVLKFDEGDLALLRGIDTGSLKTLEQIAEEAAAGVVSATVEERERTVHEHSARLDDREKGLARREAEVAAREAAVTAAEDALTQPDAGDETPAEAGEDEPSSASGGLVPGTD